MVWNPVSYRTNHRRVMKGEVMEYNLNINQRAVYELGLQDKLDAIDLLLFDFVYHLMNKPNASKMTVNGKEYVMIRHNLIAQECPILGINHRDTFRKRMLKLVDAGLLNRCDSNQEVGNSLYSRGEKFSVFVFSDQKLGTLPTKIGTPADDERHKHNTIEHNKPLNDPTLSSNDNKDSIIVPQNEEVDEVFERFWLLYDKKVERAQAERMWKKLKVSEKDEVMKNVALYVASTPDKQYRMNPATYLNPANKRWQDEIRYHEASKQSDHVYGFGKRI